MAATRDEEAVEDLIEKDLVGADHAAVGETDMTDAAAGIAGEVAGDTVALDQVAVGTAVDGDAARAEDAAVGRDAVVADDEVGIAGSDAGIGDADDDAAAPVPLVAAQHVVADLQAGGIVVDVDAAAGEGAADLEAVDQGRGCVENENAGSLVGEERIGIAIGSAEQIAGLAVPGLQTFGRIGIGKNSRHAGAGTLQPYRFPHDDVFEVAPRSDQDQVARGSGIDGRLNAATDIGIDAAAGNGVNARGRTVDNGHTDPILAGTGVVATDHAEDAADRHAAIDGNRNHGRAPAGDGDTGG